MVARRPVAIERKHGSRTATSIKLKANHIAIRRLELLNDCRVFSQEVLDELGLLISAAEPDDFRRCTAQRSDVREIRVECDEDKAFTTSKFPYGFIARLGEPDMMYLLAFRKRLGQGSAETPAQILIEEKLHAGAVMMRRSRSAA